MSANRRNFLKIFSSLPLAIVGRRAEASVTDPPAARRLLLNRFSIAGFQYYGGPELVQAILPEKARVRGAGFTSSDTKWSVRPDSGSIAAPKLSPGCPLILLVEPDNPHDPFAVSIYFGETKLGYVPRSDNKHISRLLDQEAILECRVVEINPDAWVWNMVRVEVWMVGYFQTQQ